MNSPETPAPPSSGNPWVSILLGALVVVYFLFPHLLILPWVMIYGKDYDSPTLQLLFTPVAWLGENVPWYRELMEKESELTGIR